MILQMAGEQITVSTKVHNVVLRSHSYVFQYFPNRILMLRIAYKYP